MHGAAQGESVLYVTLSESKAELLDGAASHGWSLDGVEIYEFAPTEESLAPEDQYSHFHPSEIEFQDTTQHILERIKSLEPTRVVFDSLSELRLLARDSLRFGDRFSHSHTSFLIVPARYFFSMTERRMDVTCSFKASLTAS
jgi:circadian clock protein KaiC